MDAPSLWHALKPNVASLGYGLFLAINAASVWGGTFPFLPMSFQTPSVMLGFFLAQSLVFTLSFFASAAGTYLFPQQTRRFLVKIVVAFYMAGWCLLIGAIYCPQVALPLASIGGGFLGLGSAGFYMLWQRLFASQDATVGNRDLIAGTAWAAVLYFALYLIPVAVTAYLIPLVFLPLFGLAVVLKSRTIDLDQPMFEDAPREHARTYRHILSHIWRPALAIGALGFCTGLMRSLAVADPTVGSLVNVLSMGATLLAAVTLLGMWTVKNVRISVVGAYRLFFPLVTTAFLVLPLAGLAYARGLAAVLYALWSVAIMLMMIQCAQISRDGGVNPVFIYGMFGGIVYALHDVGFMGGSLVEALSAMGIPSLGLVALVALWLLGLMYFVGQGGFRSAIGESSIDEIELMALRRPAAASLPEASSSDALHTEEPPSEASLSENPLDYREDEQPGFRDRFSKQMAMVREAYGLSARETEVAELIARGNSVARIAEMLVVSENTIRTHSKRIYTKLDIHKRQELIELVESYRPTEG